MHHAPPTAEMETAPTVETAGAAKGQSSGSIVAMPHERGKPFRSLQAEYALNGWELIDLGAEGLLAARWDRSHRLPDLDAAAAFLQLIGGCR